MTNINFINVKLHLTGTAATYCHVSRVAHGWLRVLPPLLLSLGVLRRVFAVSRLGPGPLCQSLFAHQTRAPADDPGCHPLSTGVEGWYLSTVPKNVRVAPSA